MKKMIKKYTTIIAGKEDQKENRLKLIKAIFLNIK